MPKNNRFEPKILINSYRNIADSELHSLYQFDYIHKNTSLRITRGEKVNITESALWLTALLAHWGMFRSSGKLRDQNTNFFEVLIEYAITGRKPVLKPIIGVTFDRLDSVDENEIDDIIHNLKNWLEDNGVTGTDTLISKIVLGLTSNFPGYDQNFRRGLQVLAREGVYTGVRSLSGRGLHDLVKWSKNYEWPTIKSCVDKRCNLPLARVIDMALFQYGLINPRK